MLIVRTLIVPTFNAKYLYFTQNKLETSFIWSSFLFKEQAYHFYCWEYQRHQYFLNTFTATYINFKQTGSNNIKCSDLFSGISYLNKKATNNVSQKRNLEANIGLSILTMITSTGVGSHIVINRMPILTGTWMERLLTLMPMHLLTLRHKWRKDWRLPKNLDQKTLVGITTPLADTKHAQVTGHNYSLSCYGYPSKLDSWLPVTHTLGNLKIYSIH